MNDINEEKSENISTGTTPILTSPEIDEFDSALERAEQAKEKAQVLAEANRKRYGKAKEENGELKDKIRDLELTIERKNDEITRLRRRDRGAREHEVAETKQQEHLVG